MMEWLAVFAGGGLGSLLRFAISKWTAPNTVGFPTATFLANVLACVVLGIGWTYFSRNLSLPLQTKLFVLVGFCGGFSTFSTFSLETLQLVQNGRVGMAILYVSLSVLVCMIVLFIVQKLM